MESLTDIFGTSATINLLCTFLFLFAFSLLRLQPQNARVYFPKWYIKGVRKPSQKADTERSFRKSISRYVNIDYKAYVKLLGWVWVALRMPEAELIDHGGLDSAVFLRIFLLGLKIFVPIAGLGFGILIPVNFTDHNLVLEGGGESSNRLSYSVVDKLSIANVQAKSTRLWTHLLMAYVFTIWTCMMLYAEFRKVAQMRLHHLATRRRSPDQFTVLVRQVPPDPDKSVSTAVEDFFLVNHPQYLQTQVVYNANKLANVLKKKTALENWLQYSKIKYDRNPGKRPTMKTGFFGLWGQNVDAIDYYKKEIETLDIQAAAELEVVLRNRKSIMPAAFVSFKSRWAAAVCAQTQQTNNPTKWITDWAPEPRNVYWRNLAIPALSFTMRSILSTLALTALIILYVIPVAAVQSLANLDNISKRFKFLAPIIEQKFVKSLLQGFLPGLALKIFLAILPMILMMMSKFEGHHSRSRLDQIAAAKSFYFMVVNVFFGSVITGSVAEQIMEVLQTSSVTQILKTMGNAIPMKATFFITYILVDGWAGVSWEILRLLPLILYHMKNMFIVRTPRDRDQAMAPGNLLLDRNIPRLELYFLLGIVYSVITPLIMPFIIVFFGFGYLVYRNQVINVYDPDYDSAAAFWPHVHGRIIAAMIIEQLTLIGLFTIKGPIDFVKEDNLKGASHKAFKYLRMVLSSTPFMISLPLSTLAFHWYCRRRFFAAFENCPLQNANIQDEQERKDEPDLNLEEYLHHAYLHPVLKEEEEFLHKSNSSVHGNGSNAEEVTTTLKAKPYDFHHDHLGYNKATDATASHTENDSMASHRQDLSVQADDMHPSRHRQNGDESSDNFQDSGRLSSIYDSQTFYSISVLPKSP